jgi:hypothetical protein
MVQEKNFAEEISWETMLQYTLHVNNQYQKVLKDFYEYCVIK